MAIINHSVDFASENQTIAELSGVDLGDELVLELIDASFNPAGTWSTPGLIVEAVSFDYAANFDVGLDLVLDLPSLGSVEVVYPITVELVIPDAISEGEDFTVGTNGNASLDGGDLLGSSLGLGDLTLELTLGSTGASLTNFEFLSVFDRSLVEFDSGVSIGGFGPITIPVLSFSDTIEVASTDDFEFVINLPTGEEIELDAVTADTLETLTATVTETLAELTTNPLELLDDVPLPGFAALDVLSEGLDEPISFDFLGETYEFDFEYDIIAPYISAGYALVQTVTFIPGDVTTEVTIGDEVEAGVLGDTLEFSGVDDVTGGVMGEIEYGLGGTIVVEYSLAPEGSIGIEVLGGEISLTDSDGDVIPPLTVGPVFEDSISTTFETGSLTLFDPIEITLPADFFEPITETFTIPEGGGQDIAFVIDTTGSMFDDIAAVQASVNSILDALFEDPGSRAAIVTFNDFGFPASLEANNADVLLPFTSDEDAVRDAINSIDVFGGGDFPEYTYEGLYLALSGAAGEWREDAEDRKIVLFGDAIAKDPELAAAVYSLAADLGATIDVSFAESDGVHATKLTLRTGTGSDVEIYAVTTGSPGADVVAEFTEIAERTGGTVFDAEDPDDLVATIIEIIEIEPEPEEPEEPEFDLVRGSTSADELIGGDGAELIKGFQGDDLLVGQGGADSLRGGKGDDIVFGGRGADFMTGGQGDDLLNGGAGSDTMLGGKGDDTIVMGEGLDIATGGLGNDTFVFTEATTSGRNVITDLSVGDMVDLSAFGLTWMGGDAFSGAGLQVRFREDTDRIMVDLDGDNRTDFYIQLEDGYTAADVEGMLTL